MYRSIELLNWSENDFLFMQTIPPLIGFQLMRCSCLLISHQTVKYTSIHDIVILKFTLSLMNSIVNWDNCRCFNCTCIPYVTPNIVNVWILNSSIMKSLVLSWNISICYLLSNAQQTKKKVRTLAGILRMSNDVPCIIIRKKYDEGVSTTFRLRIIGLWICTNEFSAGLIFNLTTSYFH